MEKVIVFGASGHANVVIDIIEKQKKYKIAGIFVDTPEIIGTEVMGYPVLGKIKEFYGAAKGIVAVGDNFGRQTVVNKIKEIDPSFQFIKAIHPSAILGKNVEIGEGSVVAAGVCINSNAKIGLHCIINTNSSIGHDVRIGNFSTIAPGVTIGGNTVVGDLSAISLGANVIHKIKIGSGTLIGAGSTVIRDISNGVLAYGVPAKVIRNRRIDEKYL